MPTQISNPTSTQLSESDAALLAETRLSEMTLEQKVGQVMIIGFDGLDANAGLLKMVETYHVAGVILFARNVDSPEQIARLTSTLQQAASKSGSPGLILSIDQEGGRVARLTADKGFTEFPGAMAVAATGNVENARRIASALAAEIKAVGLNTDFAPVLDVNNNPNNQVIGIRSFSSDPQVVAEYGVAFLQGLQSQGVLAFGKHFPGHGDTGVDSHVSLPVVAHDRARLEAVEFVPFKAAIQADVAGIMSAHITFPAIDPTPGLAATLSPKVLTDLLRDELHYDGLLVTDSLEMGALGESGYPVPLAAATALQAGADLLLLNRDHALHQKAYELILEWVRSGKIPQSRLDDAVRRVLVAKARFGLLQPPTVNVEAAAELGDAAEHKALAVEVAARAITLLRDQENLLPLSRDQRPYTIEISLARGLGQMVDNATSITISDRPSPAEISMVKGLARDDRPLIVCISNVKGNPEQANLVNALLEARVSFVLVALFNPSDLMQFPGAGTMLVTYGWYSPTLESLAAVLTGKIAPRGHLPMEIPGLFALGEGHSYVK